MPEYTITGGSKFTVPSHQEIADIVGAQIRAEVRGVKWMRLPLLQAAAASNTVTIDEAHTQGIPMGPEEGYAWSLRRIVVSGMTSGGTPDIVNMYRNAITGQVPLWQFNGNNFGYTFGRCEMTLMPGDTLKFSSAGLASYVASGATVSGELVEVPAEMLAKLAL